MDGTSQVDLHLRCWDNYLHSASLFDNKKGSKPRKTSIFISFPLIYFANAQLPQILKTTSFVSAMWTYTWGVGTTTFHFASIFDNKRAQNQDKLAILLVFRSYFIFANAQ